VQVKFVAWKGKAGRRQGLAVQESGSLRDLGDLDLQQLIESDASLQDLAAESAGGVRLDDPEIDYRLPLARPPKVICIGLNYKPHVVECGRSYKDPGPVEYISFFTRFWSTLVPHEGRIVRPRQSTCLDFEAEMVVIIGKAARNIPAVGVLACEFSRV
jgi:acylpyruvate hydrolase